MNQHYVPKFIIEGFVDEVDQGNRGVWVYDARYQTWRKRPARRTASLDDFYSLVESNGEREDAVETTLHETETPVALLLVKDIAARHTIGSRPRNDDIFIAFCAFLIARNPTVVDRARDAIRAEGHAILNEITASPEAFQEFRQDYQVKTGKEFPNLVNFERLRTDFQIDPTKAGALAFALSTASGWVDKLASMSVDFAFSSGGQASFVTADVPYVLVPHEHDPSEIDQVIIPLSASIAAVFNTSDDPKYRYVDVTAGDVRSANLAMLGVANNQIISSSQEVFPKELLDRWALLGRSARFELIREQKLSPHVA